MKSDDARHFQRLMLQIERDLISQTHLRALLTDATALVAVHRKELRTAKASRTARTGTPRR
jgi:hypothetical protein